MKKALIIGGNRFVGKRVAGLLKENQWHVTLVNRSGIGVADEIISSDRNNLVLLEQQFAGKSWDICYDFCCYNSFDASNTIDLLKGKLKKIVVISSGSVYERGQNITEGEFNPYSYNKNEVESFALSYAESKRQMEATFFQASFCPTVAVRFPIILGLDDYTKRLHFHVEKIRNQSPIYFPNLEARKCFVNSAEAAEFLYDLQNVEDGAGPINFCSEGSIKIIDIVKIIEEAVGKKAALAYAATEENHSPFGIEEDWYMSTEAVKAWGFSPSKLDSWLPGLAQRLVVDLSSSL